MRTDTKIAGHSDLTHIRHKASAASQTIVLATGCFDLLHLGHALHLDYCRRQGDVLVACILNDRRISQLKGDNRPLLAQGVRARMLAALEIVDHVVILEENSSFPAELGELLRLLLPDAYVVPFRDPWEGAKADLCAELGVSLVRCHRTPPAQMRGLSTTSLEEKLRSLGL